MSTLFHNTMALYAPEVEGGGGSPPAAPPPAPPAAPAPPTGTPAAAGPPAAPPAVDPPPAVWPETWRDEFSAGDEKLKGTFERFANPKEVAKALVATRQKLSESRATKLPANATADQIKEFRDAIGVPETPDKYEFDLGKDSPLTKGKPLVDAFLKAAHETNQTPAQVEAALKTFATIQTQAAEMRATADLELQERGEDTLRGEWGADFRKNVNIVQNYIDSTMTKELGDQFRNARLPDGSPIGSHPGILQGLLNLALRSDPVSSVVPSGGGGEKGLHEEIASIEKTMKENRSAYNKDEKMQSRYRELLGAREKLEATTK